MRSLYWKIFFSFWLASILSILAIAWLTSHIAQKSSIPARERVFMDSYANAAVVTFEAGHQRALLKWLKNIGLNQHMNLYLLTSKGQIIPSDNPPLILKKVVSGLSNNQLDEGILKSGNLIVSHEIISTSGTAYRLAAITEHPISHFVQIPWAGLTIRLLVAILISGVICYFLSIYLTKPLRSLQIAAKSIASGNLSTRVGQLAGHHHDEIAELSDEFDSMAEQLEALIQSKERLLQDISHELRSPLARLQVAIELARKKSPLEAEPEFNRMHQECTRLNTLIAEILEFARLEKAPTTLQVAQIDLIQLIQQITHDAHYEYRQNTFQMDLGGETNYVIKADKRLIHRAIENIIRNAVKYSPLDKPIRIQLSRDETHQLIHIDIIDKGQGIPEELLERIFHPFFRVDSSREKRTGGIGLGLAIAQQAIHLHEGRIMAKNMPSGGLQVRISLPYSKSI